MIWLNATSRSLCMQVKVHQTNTIRRDWTDTEGNRQCSQSRSTLKHDRTVALEMLELVDSNLTWILPIFSRTMLFQSSVGCMKVTTGYERSVL